jgi:ABC-type phosphate/phosphonate transport system substrate-binding protein
MPGTSRNKALRIGAVAYDPKVVTIWEGFKDYFAACGVEIDFILYSTYDAQVEANLCDAIDVAWNSPLAWVKSQIVSGGACRAIAMRDSDRDLTTKILVRGNSRLASLADLKGKTVAVGASDSPQATLIPLGMIADSGIDPRRDCRVSYNEVMVGKHGDHVGGERGSLPAFASGDVVNMTNATDIRSITDSLSPSSVVPTAIGPSCDALSPCGERCGFTLFRGNDAIG